MAKKKDSNRRPWWSIILLLFFSIINLIFAFLIENSVVLFQIKGLPTYIAFAIFSQASGLLVAGVLYLFYRGAQAYDNKGSAIDRSHIWVNAKSGKKVSDASIRSVYEKQHGYGSWEKKVTQERGCVTFFAMIASVLLTAYAFYALSFRLQLPLLTATQSLLGSGIVYWISWGFLAAVGCLAVYVISFVFWDFLHHNFSFITSPQGMPLYPENDPPSWIMILPRAIALIAGVLLTIIILVFTLFPAVRTAPIGKHYALLLSFTLYAWGFLWLFGIIFQDNRGIKKSEQRLTPEEKKEGLELAIQTLFARDSDEKERLVSAMVLLSNRDNLTPDGKKSIVEVLKIMSGQDFGIDYPKWEDWIMKQLMK